MFSGNLLNTIVYDDIVTTINKRLHIMIIIVSRFPTVYKRQLIRYNMIDKHFNVRLVNYGDSSQISDLYFAVAT